METILRNCLFCDSEFNAAAREVKRGNGKFCNLKCSAKYHGAQRPKPQPNFECAWCNAPIYRPPARAAVSKSGLHFCCDDHKNKAQSLSGLTAMHLPGYGEGKNYRDKVFKIAGKPKKCERCGYNKHEAAIVVHHIDRNRSNNDISNLEVLCANCHAIEHFNSEIS